MPRLPTKLTTNTILLVSWGRPETGGSGVCCALGTWDSLLIPQQGGKTHIESSQDVEGEPDAQVVDGAQDQGHQQWPHPVAFGEQGHDGEADQDPEEQRDQWGVQHPWEEEHMVLKAGHCCCQAGQTLQ